MRAMKMLSIPLDLTYAFTEGRRSNAIKSSIVSSSREFPCPMPSLPFFLDIKGPVELQMRLLVIVHEFRYSLVVPSSKHA